MIRNLEYPQKITPELDRVLGLMLWNTGPMAKALRMDGEDIPRKAEREQAHVLHWMIKLALEHGPEWHTKVVARLEGIAARQKNIDDALARGISPEKIKEWSCVFCNVLELPELKLDVVGQSAMSGRHVKQKNGVNYDAGHVCGACMQLEKKRGESRA